MRVQTAQGEVSAGKGWLNSQTRRGLMVVTVLALVVAVMFAGAVEAFAALGTFEGKWGADGIGDGQFSAPQGVAIAPNGDVYVADTYNDRVQFFSATGTFKGKWGTSGVGDGDFGGPIGIAVAPNGDVYVADSENHRIQYFSAAGVFKGKFGSYGTGEGAFHEPYGVAVAPDGVVYVADTYNHRVQYFSPTGTYRGQFGGYGVNNGQMRMPQGIAIAPNGDVYVADTVNNRVQHFSPAGAYKGKWGSIGSGNKEFDAPLGLAVSPDGYVYVADYHNNRVECFGWAGYYTYRGEWGTYGSGDGQFDGLNGVAIAPNGRVYVADILNERIQYFEGITAIQHDAGGVTFQRWVSGKNAAYSGGGYVYSPWAGSALEVRFVGTGITWFGPIQPNYGKAKVYMDGAYVYTVDCYASAANKKTEFAITSLGGLTNTLHTLKIVPSGTKNAASTGTNVVVDRFEVAGPSPKAYMTRHDDETGSYAGSWVKGTNAAYIGGAYRYSKYPTASYTKTFNGTRVAWIGPKTNNYGRAKIYIDGVLKATVSQHGVMGWRTKVWESASLPPGNHTLRIVPTGTKDAASKNTIIVIDAIDVR